eukprot:scaffold272575_cov14-Prasinocladus_malaysianus.AAC.1
MLARRCPASSCQLPGPPLRHRNTRLRRCLARLLLGHPSTFCTDGLLSGWHLGGASYRHRRAGTPRHLDL